MNYQNGFMHLRQCLTGHMPEMLNALSTLEDRFRKNERAERIFGVSENTRNEHAQIIYSLNELALEHCGVSFNDLCMGKQPVPREQQAQEPNEIIETLRRIEQKLDQGRAEDRQAAAQILDAIKTHEVSDTEAAQMVSELRAWTKTIEQTGLPLKPELQDALNALT